VTYLAAFVLKLQSRYGTLTNNAGRVLPKPNFVLPKETLDALRLTPTNGSIPVSSKMNYHARILAHLVAWVRSSKQRRYLTHLFFALVLGLNI
jgi:hypothetical protein